MSYEAFAVLMVVEVILLQVGVWFYCKHKYRPKEKS